MYPVAPAFLILSDKCIPIFPLRKNGRRVMEGYSNRPQKVARELRGGTGVTNLSGKIARFFFERADGELRAVCPVAEIFAAPLFQSAGALALGDMNKVMHDQFAFVPGIDSNNQSVTKSHATGVFGENSDAL